jgi:hypothetical protein
VSCPHGNGHGDCDRCDEVDARDAQIAELEAQLAFTESRAATAYDERRALEAQLAAANADRARLRDAASDTLRYWSHANHAELVRAVASSDAAAWLRERDMKVAECVRSACGSADDYNADAADGLRAAIRKLDLAAVVAGVK